MLRYVHDQQKIRNNPPYIGTVEGCGWFRGNPKQEHYRYTHYAQRINPEEPPDIKNRGIPPSSRKFNTLHGHHQDEAGMHKEEQYAGTPKLRDWQSQDVGNTQRSE